jgi:cell division protein FtsB
MNAILALLERMNPNLAKSTVYRLIEYVVLAILLVGLYQDASDSLTNAKAARDEQIKGYAVQIGVLHAEANALKDEVEGLKSWNKALSARVNRLEDAAIKGHR